jgi:hypothetical protein
VELETTGGNWSFGRAIGKRMSASEFKFLRILWKVASSIKLSNFLKRLLNIVNSARGKEDKRVTGCVL